MDRPATVLAATIGVVLILVSALLFMFGPTGEPAGGPETFAVTFFQETPEEGEADGPVGTAPSTIEVTVDNGVPSNITVSLEDCANNNGLPARGAPTISWTLTNENGTEIDSGTADCGDVGELGTYELDGHPDVGSAEDQDDVWDTGANRTATYTLTMSYARAPAQTDQLPQAQPATFSATMKLEVQEWRANLQGAEQEAPR